MATPRVDLLLLSRDAGPMIDAVERGIASQKGVTLNVHRIVGQPRPSDCCRWETIVRARNYAKALGERKWVMFLDDDVVLQPKCVSNLLHELKARPQLGAVAADYLRERRRTAAHVAMGATLFRRRALDLVTFRWSENRCECQCCCDDLRRLGIQIAYSDKASAKHLPSDNSRSHDSSGDPLRRAPSGRQHSPRVLAAFDARHADAFGRQFAPSLRAAGNDELLMALGYGLRPVQQRRILRMKNVLLIQGRRDPRSNPARQRLHDFRVALESLDPQTFVAYWDAGDVVFQDSLEKLWEMVSAYPEKLLVCREPESRGGQAVYRDWIRTIDNPRFRKAAWDLLSAKPVLNSGFAAGRAGALIKYLRFAHQARNSNLLRGTTDWGDQTAMNLYCHGDPDRWREIDEGWNYCLVGRRRGEVTIKRDGRFHAAGNVPIHVAHGNGKSFRGLVGFHYVRRKLVQHAGRGVTAWGAS